MAMQDVFSSWLPIVPDTFFADKHMFDESLGLLIRANFHPRIRLFCVLLEAQW